MESGEVCALCAPASGLGHVHSQLGFALGALAVELLNHLFLHVFRHRHVRLILHREIALALRKGSSVRWAAGVGCGLAGSGDTEGLPASSISSPQHIRTCP